MLTLEHFTTGGPLSTPAVVDLAERLVRLAPAGITKASFLSGTPEACDEAVRQAREYHHRGGEPDRYTILSVIGGDYGRTLAGAALDGSRTHDGIGPLLDGFVHVPPPTGATGDTESLGVAESLDALRAEIERVGGQAFIRSA
ncbi:hypothetical protein B1790_13315 [Mycobacterium sp. AT1]|nr:hypothetical protein B1790_13315 [Mycobacterium sp. AT1]